MSEYADGTSELPAKNNRAAFLKHTAVYGLGGLLLQAAGIVLLPLYTRYLIQADFGILEIINRTGDVLIVLLMARGISGAAFSFYCQAKDRQERARVAATVFLVTWVAILGGFGVTVVCARSLGKLLGIDDQRLLILGMAANLSQLLPALPMTFMQARVQSLRFVVASLVVMVLRVAVVVVFVAGLGLGIWGVLWGTLLALSVTGGTLSAIEFARAGFRPDWEKLGAVVRFALPFVPNGLCAFVLFSGDRYFLLKNAGPDEVGVYALAARLAGVVSMLAFTPVFKVWSAWLYRVYPRPDGPIGVGRAFTRLLAPYVFLGLAVCLFRRELVLLVATPAYIRAATILVPLILAQGLIASQVLMDGAFYVHRRTALKLGPTITATIVIVVLQVFLVPRYGCIGAALAALGAYGVYASMTYVLSQRVFWVHYEWGRLVGMVCLAVVLSLLGWWVGYDLEGIALRSVLLIAWPAGLWLGGFFTTEEKALAWQVLRRARARSA
ncbi:MAG: lipopolysaccharide biosynthesis protein [Candidatus Oleimicrobiaceae bacterium]